MKVDEKKAQVLAKELLECYGESTEKSQQITINAFGSIDNLGLIALASWGDLIGENEEHQVVYHFAAAVDLGVRIGLAQKNGDEVEEEETSDWEDEERVIKLVGRAFLFKRLTPFYELEDVRLICKGKMPIPSWLIEEMKVEIEGKSARPSGC